MMQKTIFGALFLLFLALSCEKTDASDYYESELYVRAVTGDQRVKLCFYLCNANTTGIVGGPQFGCDIEPNAYFDVYQMKPDSTEEAKLASNVSIYAQNPIYWTDNNHILVGMVTFTVMLFIKLR